MKLTRVEYERLTEADKKEYLAGLNPQEVAELLAIAPQIQAMHPSEVKKEPMEEYPFAGVKNLKLKSEKEIEAEAKKAKETKGCLGCLGIILLGVILAASDPFSSPTSTLEFNRSMEKIDAWVEAKSFVTENLKAPSTASFGSPATYNDQHPDERVSIQGDGIYVVRIWVDAQNSFGAMIRTNYIVTMHHQGGDDDAWKLMNIQSEP